VPVEKKRRSSLRTIPQPHPSAWTEDAANNLCTRSMRKDLVDRTRDRAVSAHDCPVAATAERTKGASSPGLAPEEHAGDPSWHQRHFGATVAGPAGARPCCVHHRASDHRAMAATRPHPQRADHAQRRRSPRHRLDQSRGGGRTPQAVLAGMK
jgi:hypothetical protein